MSTNNSKDEKTGPRGKEVGIVKVQPLSIPLLLPKNFGQPIVMV